LEALMLLHQAGSAVSMHRLAENQSITPSSATQLVDRLVRMGLVERLRAGERGVPGVRGLYSRLGKFDVRFRYLIVVVWLVVTVVCVRTLPGLGSVAK